MAERTRLEKIRARDAFDFAVLEPAEMLEQCDHDRRWLLEVVDYVPHLMACADTRDCETCDELRAKLNEVSDD